MQVSYSVALAVIAALAFLAACGGDDEDPNATPTPEPTEPVTLVFPRTTGTGFEFIEVQRELPVSQATPQGTVMALLDGPTDEEAAEHNVVNPFPQRVEVLSLDVLDGTATADFTEELLDYGGGAANVQAITESITRTIQAATDATEVIILVAGEENQLQP